MTPPDATSGRLLAPLRRAIGVLGLVLLVGSTLALALRFVTVSRPLLTLSVAVASVGVLAGAGAVLIGLAPRQLWPRLGVVAASVLMVFGATGANPIRLLCLSNGSSDAAPDGSMTLYSHNVGWSFGDPVQVAEQIIDSNADVVMLQESDAAYVGRVQEQLGDRYPYVEQAASTKTTSLATLSRSPLTDVVDTSDEILLRNPTLVTTVQFGDETIRVANIHTSAPGRSILSARWIAEYEQLAERTFEADMLVGDFNASAAHKPFRDVLGAGFRDAHAESGCGTGVTWTVLGAGPSVLHLDHVLVTEDVQIHSYRTVGRGGSDHRAMVVVIS